MYLLPLLGTSRIGCESLECSVSNTATALLLEATRARESEKEREREIDREKERIRKREGERVSEKFLESGCMCNIINKFEA